MLFLPNIFTWIYCFLNLRISMMKSEKLKPQIPNLSHFSLKGVRYFLCNLFMFLFIIQGFQLRSPKTSNLNKKNGFMRHWSSIFEALIVLILELSNGTYWSSTFIFWCKLVIFIVFIASKSPNFARYHTWSSNFCHLEKWIFFKKNKNSLGGFSKKKF